MSLKKTAASLLLGLSFASFAPTLFAANLSLGNLTFENTTLRATAPGAKVAGGYLFVTNNGETEETLLMGQASFAGIVQVHETKMKNGVMAMQAMEGGLAIPPGTTAKLLPGGNHLMFMKLKKPLVAGDSHRIILKFKNAGMVNIPFDVKSIGDTLKLKALK